MNPPQSLFVQNTDKNTNFNPFFCKCWTSKDTRDTSWKLSYKIRSFFVGNKYNMSLVFTAAEKSLISTSTKLKLVSAHRLETTDDALNFMLETFACVHRKTSEQLILAVRQTTTFNPAHKRIRAGTQLTFSPLHCCNHQTTAQKHAHALAGFYSEKPQKNTK